MNLGNLLDGIDAALSRLREKPTTISAELPVIRERIRRGIFAAGAALALAVVSLVGNSV